MTNKKTPQPDKPKSIKYRVSRRDAIEAFSRLRTNAQGAKYVVRFSPSRRIEHILLIVSFVMLAITGLAQTFSNTPVAFSLLNLLGGIDAARQLHHFFSFIAIALAGYHFLSVLNDTIVYQRIGGMMPNKRDFDNFNKMLKFNLGLSKTAPQFERYTFEQKFDYWFTVAGVVVMGITGLMQLFPYLVTDFLPGTLIPAARMLHRWGAILAVLFVITWHFYHTALKKLNLSIFTGTMSLEDMQENHALELIFLEKAAAVVNNNEWPVSIEIPLETEETEPPAEEPPAEETVHEETPASAA